MKLIFCTILLTLCVAGCSDKSTLPATGSPTSPAVASSESTETGEPQSFGEFSISIPAGWAVGTPDRNKTKALLLLDGTNWQNAKAMIKIDVGAPAAPSANELAEAFAKSTSGSVSKETLDFDGTPGVIASTSSTELTTPQKMIVIYHDDKAYLVMVGATAGVDVNDAVTQLRESWKWK